MASRKTIVLLIIFSGLLAYVYFFEIKGAKRKQAQKEQQELLINLDKAHVTGLSFLPGEIIIKKDSTGWKVTSPIQSEADQSTIESILDAFSWLKKGRFVSDIPDDFRKFGLNPYQYALVFEQGGINDTLLVGDANLDDTSVFYRKKGSNNVYLVPTALKNNVTKTLYDLRDKSILKFERGKIDKIIITNQENTFSCVKDSNQQWWLNHPIKALCDEDKFDNMLSQLHDSIVKKYESEQATFLNKYGLNNPWLSVSISDSSGQQKKLVVGKKDQQEYFARDESRSQIFRIDSSLVAELDVSLFDLRDKTIVAFEQDSVTEIMFQYPDFTFHCIKDSANHWLITQPDSGLAKSWKVSSLFYDLQDVKVAQFIDEPSRPHAFYGFDHPAIKLILKGNDSILSDLVIGKTVKDKIYLKNNLTQKIYFVKQQVKNNLSIKTEEFIDK